MTVVPIRHCRTGCGAAASRRELAFRDEKVCDFWACDTCVSEIDRELDAARPVFDAMLAAGVPRETANDAMTFLLERWKP